MTTPSHDPSAADVAAADAMAHLPSVRSLRRATALAIALAALLAIAVVLPAEYAVDPTGIGSKLGLTQMGRLKLELAREAAEDARADSIAAAK